VSGSVAHVDSESDTRTVLGVWLPRVVHFLDLMHNAELAANVNAVIYVCCIVSVSQPSIPFDGKQQLLGQKSKCYCNAKLMH
jgi:hypothetical protein